MRAIPNNAQPSPRQAASAASCPTPALGYPVASVSGEPHSASGSQWRSLDGNAFHPLGVAEEQLHLLEVLLRFSLLSGSPRIKAHERQTIDPSQVLAARLRREPGLLSEGVVSDVEPRAWRRDLLAAMEPVAGLLGGLHGDTGGTSLRM